MKLRTLLCLCTALTGCSTYSLQELRQTAPQGSPFQTTLALKYLEFADQEEKQYDWPSSWHFADKGLQAAYGHDVEPEQPETWNVPSELLPQLQQARSTLMEALTENTKENNPRAAAEAVFFYDCWVEQQQENWQEDDIAYCREHFESALQSLKTVESQSIIPHAQAEEIEKTSYLVFFGLNRAELDEPAEHIISKVVENLRAGGTYDVVLNGHTDTAGSAKHNMSLSRQRAETVKAALIARGILAKRISVYGFGETDPLKHTRDGIKEPKNRRVEIFVN